MKIIFLFVQLLLIPSLISFGKTESQDVTLPKTDISEYLGQWTIDISSGSVGWIEIRHTEKYIDAYILWGGGSVVPVSNIFLANDRMLVIQRSRNVVRMRDKNNNPLLTAVITDWLEIIKNGEDKIKGILLRPRSSGIGIDTILFVGNRLPPVPSAPDLNNIKYGTSIALFNGKDMNGWILTNPKQSNGFKVVDGVLVNDPVQKENEPHVRYGNLRTENIFRDFNLKLEVDVPQGSNSGVYLRGMYEIQISDSYGQELNSHNMGALYSRIKPSVNAEKPSGEWQSLDMTLYKRHLTVILNGVKIIENQPIYGPTGGALLSDVFSPGPIYLQGDHGKVSFRNIVLTPILE